MIPFKTFIITKLGCYLHMENMKLVILQKSLIGYILLHSFIEESEWEGGGSRPRLQARETGKWRSPVTA